jgi:hypothetical protein
MPESGRIFTEGEAERVQQVVEHVEKTEPYLRARRKPIPVRMEGGCAYYHEFEISGGLPTDGSQVWSYTIDTDTQNVTVDFNETAGSLKTEFLATFAGLSSADLTTTGGPLPEVPITVQWKNTAVTDVSSNWPPTVGANTMNNAAWMQVHQINPRV